MSDQSQVEQAAYITEAHDAADAGQHYCMPGHMQAVAHLYGLEAPAPDTARVLEIGCGRGRHLQPFALSHPHAEIIAIDLWLEDLEQGLDEAEALGIQNIQFRHMAPDSVDMSLGLFDYIIIRDQYTWSSNHQREAIWRICKSNLAPKGLAYMGFHALPGSHVLDTLRDAIQLHASSESTLQGILPYAQGMLQVLAVGASKKVTGTQKIRDAAAHMLLHPEHYIHADFLQRQNNTSYLIDIITEAQAHGLGYLADTLPGTEIPSAYGVETHFQNSLISLGKGTEIRQQYLDFASNRQFRQALFSHTESTVHRSPDQLKQRLVEMHYACGLQRKYAPTTREQGGATFRSTADQEFVLTDNLEIAVCDALAASWPRSLSFEELLGASTVYEMPNDSLEDRRDALIQAIYALIQTHQLRYRLTSGPYNRDPEVEELSLVVSDHYIANQKGKPYIRWNLWGDSQAVSLGESPESFRSILARLNGPNPEVILNNPDLVNLIEQLRWHGVLQGSDQTWLRYYAALFRAELKDDTVKLHLLQRYMAHYCGVVHEVKNKKQQNKHPILQGSKIQKSLLGLQTLRHQGDIEALKEAAASFIADWPDNAEGWNMLALADQDEGRHDDARASLWRAIALDPGDVNLYLTLSNSLVKFSRTPISWLGLAAVLRLNPEYAQAYINLGMAWWALERKALAMACYQRALVLEPGNLTAQKNVAVTYGENGELEKAVDLLEKCIRKDPKDYKTYSSYLFMLSLSDQVTPSALFEAHKKFGQQVIKDSKKTGLCFEHHRSNEIGRKLRLGFVSGDLYNHAVFSFIYPIWKNIDKNKFSIHAYCTHAVEDHQSEQLRGLSSSWDNVTALSHEALAKKIHDDQIDILFDLSGHTGYNRLPTFAYKPAPIQISWIGYPGTTGLAAMDYFITNKYAVPSGMLEIENQFTERFIRLPTAASFHLELEGYFPNRQPCLKNGYFTFGSFNRMNKMNDTVYAAWGKILRSVPTARLLLGHMDPGSHQPMKDRFAALGISEDRLILEPRAHLDKYMRLHHQVDLLLDAFPYNGGTTTMYGLWMGVPTLTLAGNTLRSRTGANIIGPFGIDNLIANDPNEYVDLAVGWTDKTEKLASVRRNARGYFDSDSIYGAQSVTKNLEKALGIIWSDWCSSVELKDVEID